MTRQDLRFRNILLIQLGDIGDVVWTTPAIRALEAAFPDARLSLLVRTGSAPLLAYDPFVRRIYEIRHGREGLAGQSAPPDSGAGAGPDPRAADGIDPGDAPALARGGAPSATVTGDASAVPSAAASRAIFNNAAAGAAPGHGPAVTTSVFGAAPGAIRRWLRRRTAGMSASFRQVLELRRARFDLVIDLRGDERGAFTGFSTGAPVRVAQYEPDLPWWRNRLFTHPIVMPPGEERAVNAAEQSLRILRGFGIPAAPTVPRLHVAPEALAAARALIASCGLAPDGKTDAGSHPDRSARGAAATRRAAPISTDPATDMGPGRNSAIAAAPIRSVPVPVGAGPAAPPAECPPPTGTAAATPWITLNPFSRWAYKEWADGNWVPIIDRVWAEYGLATVIVGSESERRRAEAIRSAAQKSSRRPRPVVVNLAGRTDLAVLAALLSLSRLHVGVDSAGPHIAAAVGTPTLTLYGPTDPVYWTPPGDGRRVVAPEMPCAPCRRKGCEDSGASRCMADMTVERVMDALHGLLAAEGAHRRA